MAFTLIELFPRYKSLVAPVECTRGANSGDKDITHVLRQVFIS